MTYDNTTANTDESLAVDATKGPRGDTVSNEQLEDVPSDNSSKARAANNRKEEDEEESVNSQQRVDKPNKPSTSSSSSSTSTSLTDNLATVSSSSSKQDVKSEQPQDNLIDSVKVEAKISDQLQQIEVGLRETEQTDTDSVKQTQKKEESKVVQSSQQEEESEPLICYDPVLDNEIRNRLDKLNALSDLINSLELQFDQANALFRETLKCSTDRLSTIAKTLGSKSIRQGRIYHAAKVSVEQSQTDCQRACVQFEQANNDHQFAKLAIKEAELKLKEINLSPRDDGRRSSLSLGSINICGLKLGDDQDQDNEGEGEDGANEKIGKIPKECDNNNEANSKSSSLPPTIDADILHDEEAKTQASGVQNTITATPELAEFVDKLDKDGDSEGVSRILNSAKLSEDLNQAIGKLLDAEQKRRQSERMHLDQANKLMIAQENLTKLEREHGASIRRAQVYFEEARRFNARLNSVKSDIARISEDIVGAKQAYARTLNELEQFSEDLHISSRNLLNNARNETNS